MLNSQKPLKVDIHLLNRQHKCDPGNINRKFDNGRDAINGAANKFLDTGFDEPCIFIYPDKVHRYDALAVGYTEMSINLGFSSSDLIKNKSKYGDLSGETKKQKVLETLENKYKEGSENIKETKYRDGSLYIKEEDKDRFYRLDEYNVKYE